MKALSKTLICIVALLLLSSYFAFGLISVFGISHSAHGAGCEFTLGSETLCSMSSMGLSKMYSTLFAGMPTFAMELLLTGAVLCAYFLFVPSVRFKTIPIPRWRYRIVRMFSLWVQLFSRGILHPKNP